MRRLIPVALAALLLTGCAAPAADPADRPDTLEGTVTVFAAASLQDAFETIAGEFTAEHPNVEVAINFGGSSGLATQITEGAPADVFAAANESTMASVVDAGDAVDPRIFTSNTLEIVVPAGNPGGVTGLDDLADADLAVALCDAAVPCGSASQALFDLVGVTPRPDTLEESVTAVLTKVQLGEADAGLVYVTDVIAGGRDVEGVVVPEASEVISLYPISLLGASANPDAAQAFIDYVLGGGQGVLADAGFVAP